MMRQAFVKFAGIILLAISLLLSAIPGHAQEYEGKQLVTAQLLTDVKTVAPGTSFQAGVEFVLEPGWHIYWKYPGDAGMPTSVEWQAPEGVVIQELHWPLPYRVQEPGDIEVYAYKKRVMLTWRITVPEDYSQDTLALTANAAWLVCKEICVPGDASLTLELPVSQDGDTEPISAEKFLYWQEHQPQRVGLYGLPFKEYEWTKGEESLVLELTDLDVDLFAQGLDFFPLPGDNVTIGHPKVVLDEEAKTATVTVPVLDGLENVEALRGILVAEGETAETRLGWFVERLEGIQMGGPNGLLMEDAGAVMPDDADKTPPAGEAGPGTGTGTGTGTDSGAGSDQTGAAPGGEDSTGAAQKTGAEPTVVEVQGQQAAAALPLIQVLFLAFLAGLILNVMPCVLPAISIKIFGFIEQAQEDPRRILIHGLSFAAGILLFFLALGGVAIAISSGGSLYTWGSQFQNPAFVIFLIVVVFVFALNLFGIFEISLPGAMQTGASQAAGAGGYFGSFLHGLLATLLATACTAPFMGVALTSTLGQPPIIILTVFAALGLGMALPYLLLSANPKWMKLLPRPGSWMEAVKQFMGFLLLATAAWLYFTLLQLVSAQAAGWVLASLVGMGFGLWLWGIVRPKFQGGGAITFATLAVLAFLGSTALLFAKDVTEAPKISQISPDLENLVTSPTLDADGELNWQPWSPAAIDAALDQGRIVFIDFTATWCVTCQSNKRLVMNTDPVQEAFAANNVLPLKADFTRRDEKIEAAIHSYKRIGIPVNVFYSPKAPDQPVLLPEVLSTGVVLETLQALEKGEPAAVATI